eukprot:Blabericola_migrator_1__2959@NODE_1855_length_3657_cov_58_127577_g1186_i0_p4_GENE_NODE_1855_length_3657_cov_58_127577_g1186_i0NODE_1855_length_3657_cov_58_127577_g1186_i0_p4_ORF_typecomplete_len112_score2_52IL4Ra_N/PF09238_10/1_9e03IL4Ra_N/PF09238_10/0_017_NODE_1855_length_3657_cov_58_127577_g1186_i029543289
MEEVPQRVFGASRHRSPSNRFCHLPFPRPSTLIRTLFLHYPCPVVLIPTIRCVTQNVAGSVSHNKLRSQRLPSCPTDITQTLLCIWRVQSLLECRVTTIRLVLLTRGDEFL